MVELFTPGKPGLSFLVEGISVWLDTSLLMSSFVRQTPLVYVRLETGSRLLSQVLIKIGSGDFPSGTHGVLELHDVWLSGLLCVSTFHLFGRSSPKL